ncbi:Leucine rich repeat-containing protein [Pseudomonas sp. UC 17F4]|uniref:NEL-type E3 ubiquitin ligase domain-containing protein n=1 Tax=Pseudomonas sp. UC 17F4 TaxID=1855328 RepID=UPI00088AE89A|nr:NEL-type E3 ubiquitin ligase domain-containing protein [Pseudomonas sp. UC 17F4]SDQ64469.1 Leucine rich repeat-containing protein [Pseudomonas sp. UC 17F4]
MNDHDDASIDSFIAQRLPGWLRDAPLAAVQALQQSMGDSQRAQVPMQALLDSLQSPEDFAAPLLSAALSARFAQRVNVHTWRLRLVRRIIDGLPQASLPPVFRVQTRYQSPLHAALHNFAAEEAVEGSHDQQTAIIDEHGTVQPLSVAAFARLCRELDVGGKYQAHIKSFFSPAAEGARQVNKTLEQSWRSGLAVALNQAWIKGDLDDASHQCLLRTLAFRPLVPNATLSSFAHHLNLLGKRLVGVVAFELREQLFEPNGYSDVLSVVLYIPDDPLKPLKQYTSWDAAYSALAARFAQAGYARFFQRFVSERDRGAFLTTLRRLLTQGSTGSAIELDGRHFAFAGPLLATLSAARIAKIEDDARVLAVPTDDEDRTERSQRLQEYQEIGLTLANLAGFFVPGLGEVMLGVAVAQLLGEVYHGYEDWQQGDREGAMNHLLGVAENLAANALLLAGGKVLVKALQRSGFVDGLVPVELADQRQRLWNPDLQTYRDNAFAHRFETVGATGWRPAWDSPQHWQGSEAMLKRFGGQWQQASDAQLQRVLAITGTQQAQIRQWQVHGEAPPATLVDALERVRLDHQLASTLSSLSVGNVGQPAPVLLRALTALEGWPEQVLVTLGEERFGQATQTLPRTIELSPVPSASGDWLDQVLLALEETDKLALLTSPGEGLSERQQLLARLSRHLEQRRAEAFDFLYAHSRQEPSAGAQILQRNFPGLPLVVAEEICSHARADHLQSLLDTSKVPLAMLEEARLLMREVRINRALEAVHLQSPGRASSATLAALSGARREEVAGIIGLSEPGQWFHPPQRLADGRIGYPLSGRGVGGRQAVNRAVRELYPTFSDAEVGEFLTELRVSGRELWSGLQALHQELATLNETLYSWQAADPIRGAARERVAARLRRCWRRQTARVRNRGADYRLLLEHEPIGALPQLPESISFAHVAEITLNDLQITDLPPGFLQRFSALRWLDVVHGDLARVPEGIDGLNHLTWLNLSHNRIAWTPADNQLLASLGRLEVLDLDHNPLASPPDVTALSRLRLLRLRSTAITTVPAGLLSRPALESADLRENPIVVLQEGLFNAPRRILERINFHDNPLNAESRERLLAFERAGLLPAVAGFSHARFDNLQEEWLSGSQDEVRVQRAEQWRVLQGEEGSADLFRLLGDLRETADFRRRRQDLTRRVWEVLEGCYDDTRLRRALFALARAPRSCSDSVALNFSALEVRAHELTATRGLSGTSRQQPLLNLARSLFRLDEVDRLSAEEIQLRRAMGMAPDEIEVLLAFRTGLADELELVGQPRNMAYRFVAGVDRHALNTMRDQVRMAERTPRLAASVAARGFWVRFIEAHQQAAFDALDQAFFQQLESLQAMQAELTDQQYLQRSNGIGAAREAARGELVLQLTTLALGLHPAASAGVMSEEGL